MFVCRKTRTHVRHSSCITRTEINEPQKTFIYHLVQVVQGFLLYAKTSEIVQNTAVIADVFQFLLDCYVNYRLGIMGKLNKITVIFCSFVIHYT